MLQEGQSQPRLRPVAWSWSSTSRPSTKPQTPHRPRCQISIRPTSSSTPSPSRNGSLIGSVGSQDQHAGRASVIVLSVLGQQAGQAVRGGVLQRGEPLQVSGGCLDVGVT